jgi:hypothetical protein
MAQGKIPGVRNVSKKEARELSTLPWVPDDEVLSTFGQARVLPDGRVLLLDPSGGTLYPSRAAAEEMNRRLEETKRQMIEQAAGRVPHPALTLLPPIDDFLRDVEAHAKKLGPRIGIADEALDGTLASLDAVDQALKKIPWAKRQVADLVTPLTAYVGEVMRKASGGRWVMTRSRGNENQPLIQARDGRLLEPFGAVYLPMVEPSRRIPLRAAVDVMVMAYRPGISPKPAA